MSIMDAQTAEKDRSQSRFISAREIGQELGVSTARVYQMVAEGALPAVRVSPRRLLFPRRVLDEMERVAIDKLGRAAA